MDCSVKEARELVANAKLWPRVRRYLAAGGAFEPFPPKDPSRLKLLDAGTRKALALWIEGIAAAEDWRRVVDGAAVRKIKADYPGVYPDVFRYTAYFTRWRAALGRMVETAKEKKCSVLEVPCPDFAMVLLLMKLKFPEAYEICCS